MSERRRARHAARPRIAFALAASLLAVTMIGALAWRLDLWPFARAEAVTAAPSRSPTIPSPTPTVTSSPSPPPPTPVPSPEPANTDFAGITTFRGNETRSYYGAGPVPRHPEILWRYPASGSLCSISSDQDGPREWCGTGWTGQPNVIVRRDGKIEVRINAYDGAYHFLNGRTGEPIRPQLQTGDLAKGSATSDPDGYPLYYAGSRDNLFRVIALDRPEPTVLWELNADTSVPNPVWNDDWDGAPLVVGDYLLEGGENSWFYVIRLHRDYDARGKVTVDPEVVLTVPGFDDELLATLPDSNVSIESSVAFDDGVAYFANSGGLVQGWDISRVLDGGTKATRVFRFWTGEDTDASVVIDEDGLPVRRERGRAVHGSRAGRGAAHEARSPAPRRSSRLVVRHPRTGIRGIGRRLGHAGAVREDGVRRDEPRGPDRARTRDRARALEGPPGRPHVVVAGPDRRRAAARRLRGHPARVRHLETASASRPSSGRSRWARASSRRRRCSKG